MEKKRLAVSESVCEPDKHFLDRTGVSTQLREVLTKMIENRPDDPIAFIADFFEGQGSTMDRVSKAHQQLMTTHYSKPAFHNNVRTAFDLMSFHKRKSLKGVTGVNYMELINLLSRDFPDNVREQLLSKLTCRDHEVIVFDIFKSAVFTCLVLADFLSQAEGLYKSLDTQKSNKVDKVVCDTLTLQLGKAVSTESNPAGMMEAGYLLGPDKVYSSLATAMFNTKGQKGTVTCEEFVGGAAECFLSKASIRNSKMAALVGVKTLR